MARIVFSMSGEGRGHATRARALIEALRDEHELRVLAPDQAFDLLAPAYRGGSVRVERLPGAGFRYAPDGRLSYPRTALAGARHAARLPALVERLARELREDGADLAVCDFEPVLPRAARRAGVPFASVTHQHLLSVCDLSSLPPALRRRARAMGLFVSGYYRGQAATVVSSFHCPPPRPGQERALRAGVLLRPEVRSLAAPAPVRGTHVVAYLRRELPEPVLGALQALGRPVHVYGLGARERWGRLDFRGVDARAFVEDLAGAAGLVCTAGNQVVGEALWLGVPVFAIPEPGNFEQHVNAHLLADSGAGEWAAADRLQAGRLARFLERGPELAARVDRRRLDGLPAVLGALRSLLPQARPLASPAVAAHLAEVPA